VAGPGKIRTAIVDDEPLARSNLSTLLRLDPEIEIVSECGSGVDAPKEIRRAQPDLLFLDVQMPECDGFDVLELLGKDVPAAVVFVTAYDQYALRAFEAGALDYLLKPFDDARFGLAVGRAKQKIARGKDQPRKLEFLTIKSAGQVAFVSLPEIDWIEAADYYAPGKRNHPPPQPPLSQTTAVSSRHFAGLSMSGRRFGTIQRVVERLGRRQLRVLFCH
jgi:two-component system, LytTR family, response regulator